MTGAVALVRSWIADLDGKIERYVERMELVEGAVSCRTCTEPACCRQIVLCHLFEVLPIVERLRAEGRDTPALRERLRRDADDMERLGFGDGGWWDSGRGCPFLVDRRCSIYEARPSSCRAYYVLSPAELCASGGRAIVKMLGCRNHAEDDAVATSMAIHAALGLRRRPAVYVDFLPRTVVRLLRAHGRKDWAAYVDRQDWPDYERVSSWRGLRQAAAEVVVPVAEVRR